MNNRKSPALEELHAELLYLVTRYSCEPRAYLADAVSHQLQKILAHPLIDVFPQLRRQCATSHAVWRARARFQSPGPAPAAAAVH